MENKHILVVVPTEKEHKIQLEAVAPGCTFTYDGMKTTTAEQVQAADIIIGNVVDLALLKDAKHLEWLQLNSAGADLYTKPGVLPEGTKLTNCTGAYGLGVAEHQVGMLLGMMKHFPIYRDQQRAHVWKDQGTVCSIYGATVLIVGLGDIGNEFAKCVKAMGGYTIGVRRKGTKKPDYIDELYHMDQLDELIPRADVISLSLPNTPETYKLFHRERLEKMKQGSFLLNVGRGTAVDCEALAKELQSGHLAGAGLDVTDPEPLPEGHPLWECRTAFITPHVSGWFNLRVTHDRIINICAENLRRYFNGEALMNEVDFQTGYRRTGE